MNIFKKIKDWCTEKYLNAQIDKNVKEFNKEVDQNINMWSNRDNVEILQEEQETQQKYYNGIGLMKRRLRDLGGSNALNNFRGQDDFYVGRDLLSLAKDENAHRKALRETKESVYVYSGADVKSDKDKEKMVDKRINHYNQLHNKKEERELIRKARRAYKLGNMEVYDSLMKKWEREYNGKS